MIRLIGIFLLCLFSTLSFSYTFETKNYPIHSKERYELMKAYSKQHYGLNHANLIDPQMIVIHYTAIPTLESSLKAFKSAKIPSFRDQLTPYGDVNVGVHFVVSRDGEIYTLLPTTLMGRHTVGFNYTAIGIENVSSSGDGLTDKQIEANAMIIDQLLFKHPTIRYLIGHMEYMNQRYPHFKLFKALDKSYTPKIKVDPGFKFLKRLRHHLKKDYGIVLLK
ncbi:N-acetylmuramoyl-L-alanine amidase [Candidatus Marinamargulisbacteria bacterium SCGC AG-343-D04]|nr:N-acetylmuramoyl-L-alanine amidase [Candidatus Marinamargulisbacteria bacterium SCGC AG-343-D04]